MMELVYGAVIMAAAFLTALGVIIAKVTRVSRGVDQLAREWNGEEELRDQSGAKKQDARPGMPARIYEVEKLLRDMDNRLKKQDQHTEILIAHGERIKILEGTTLNLGIALARHHPDDPAAIHDKE